MKARLAVFEKAIACRKIRCATRKPLGINQASKQKLQAGKTNYGRFRVTRDPKSAIRMVSDIPPVTELATHGRSNLSATASAVSAMNGRPSPNRPGRPI
jgi:hypothetical protein